MLNYIQIYFKIKLSEDFLIAQRWLFPFLLELGIFFAFVIIPLVWLIYYLVVFNRYQGRWDYYQLFNIMVVLLSCFTYYLYIQYSINTPLVEIITIEPVAPVVPVVPVVEHKDEIISWWVIVRTLGQVSILILMR
jgi:hypothetical protein